MTSLPAGPLLFDTGVYIRFSRGENYLWLGEDARVFQRTILTAVVARGSSWLLHCRDIRRYFRVLVPTLCMVVESLNDCGRDHGEWGRSRREG